MRAGHCCACAEVAAAVVAAADLADCRCTLRRYEVHGAESSDDEEDGSGSEEEGSEDESGSGDGSGEEEEGSDASGSDVAGGSGSHGHAAEENGSQQQQHSHSHAHGHAHGGCCGGGDGCSGHHSHGHKHGSSDRQQEGQEEQADPEGEALPAVMASGPASIYGLRSGEGLRSLRC